MVSPPGGGGNWDEPRWDDEGCTRGRLGDIISVCRSHVRSADAGATLCTSPQGAELSHRPGNLLGHLVDSAVLQLRKRWIWFSLGPPLGSERPLGAERRSAAMEVSNSSCSGSSR
jgi:hypothetical protein